MSKQIIKKSSLIKTTPKDCLDISALLPCTNNLSSGSGFKPVFERPHSTDFVMFFHPRHFLMKSHLQVLNMIISIMINCWGVNVA